MAAPPVSTTISHSPRSLRDRTRREDRHLKFYELRDNLLTSKQIGEAAAAQGIVLHELVRLEASLEEAFMELTREDVEFRAGALTSGAGSAEAAA